jgi:hypothetical protein
MVGTSAAKAARDVVATPTLCPACRQASEGVPRGFVTLEGGFLVEHRDEIVRLLENEVQRTAEDNPLARILERTWKGATRLMVATTTAHLAQRLGQALEKAFGGETTFKFSHENKLTRVAWRRES